MAGLRQGAIRVAEESGAQAIEFEVPGTFELAVVAAECESSGQFDAIVALGVVIRGGTPHFEYVCSAATQGLTEVSVQHRVPVGFGVLTCDNVEQAKDRAGLPGSREDKGAEAMASALRTAAVLASIRA
jgi:6,7-dimethyl-8-ribityllumazine synthase